MASVMRVLGLALLCVGALGLDENVWAPTDSVHALDGVIAAVNQIVSNPHLSATNLAKAKTVAEDIKVDIEAVEGGKLSKKDAHDKVGSAIKELLSLQSVLAAPMVNNSARAAKLEALEKSLTEKKAQLMKAENMLKLMKLKKALAEKKLKLQNMIDAKNAAKNGGAEAKAEAARAGELVKALSTGVSAIKGSKNDELKTVLATVRARKDEVSASISKVEETEKKGEAELEAVIKAQMPGGAEKGDEKAKAMLKQLKSEEHRKFAKVEAMKKIQLNELKDAEASIEKHDAAGLERTLAKIEKEGKTLQSKSGKFLV